MREAWLPLIVSLSAPGPMIAMGAVILICPNVSVIVLLFRLGSKVIAQPELALARLIAVRKSSPLTPGSPEDVTAGGQASAATEPAIIKHALRTPNTSGLRRIAALGCPLIS